MTPEKKKTRSRSKSPFRSFRFKKSKPAPEQPGSVSDDEGNIAAAAERPGPGAEGSLHEGFLTRKHEWESTIKKASNRSWEKLFMVLQEGQLVAYKDARAAKAAPTSYHHGESPLLLQDATVQVASDYSKKKHVFRLKLPAGGEYLFQARDDADMHQWVAALEEACAAVGAGASGSKSKTLPAASQEQEPKKRSFFTLKKK